MLDILMHVEAYIALVVLTCVYESANLYSSGAYKMIQEIVFL